MKRSAILLMLLLLTVSVCGCVAPRDPLSYRSKAFEAEIIIRSDTSEASARISLGPPTNDGTPRDATLTFLSPEHLAGITLTRKSGKAAVSSGDITLPFDMLSYPIDLFSLNGSVISVELTTLGQKKATLVKLESDGRLYEIYVSENDVPLKISDGHTRIDVVWFE